jgi:hypothetical protein
VYLYHPGIISVTKTVGIHAGASQRPPHRCSLGGHPRRLPRRSRARERPRSGPRAGRYQTTREFCIFFRGVSSFLVPSRRPAGKGARVCAGGRGRECGPAKPEPRKLLTTPKKLHIPAPVWYRTVGADAGRHPGPSRASSETAKRLSNPPEGARLFAVSHTRLRQDWGY